MHSHFLSTGDKDVSLDQSEGKLKITQKGGGLNCRITSFSVCLANGTAASPKTNRLAITTELELHGLPKYFNYVVKFYRNNKELRSTGFGFNITRTEEISNFYYCDENKLFLFVSLRFPAFEKIS